jgi:hypothetical protein
VEGFPEIKAKLDAPQWIARYDRCRADPGFLAVPAPLRTLTFTRASI